MAKKSSSSAAPKKPAAYTVPPQGKKDKYIVADPAINEQPVWQKVFMISLIAVFILMTLMSFHYGISGDEVDMNAYGKAILKYFTSFGSDTTVFHMPKQFDRDNNIQYYGGLFDLICALVNKVSPLNEYTTRHILNAWAGFLAIFFAAKMSVRMFNKQAGVICVWLMFLSPFFLGHAMNNPKDIPFAATYIMAIYFIVRFFDKMPKPSFKDYLWVILSIGATINIRIGGLLLIPYMFVYLAFIYITYGLFRKEEQIKLSPYYKPLIIVAVISYFAGSLLWPYGLQNPISNPLTALSEMSNFKVNIAQIFEGKRVFSGDLPARFLPESFLITNTYALLVGLVLIVLFLWTIRKRKYAPLVYFILFTGIFPVVYIIYKKSNVYHAWRHVLFIFPSLVAVASGGWYLLSEYLAQKKLKFAGMALLGILLLEPLYFTVSTFPNTITYFNAFAGGIKGAYGNYEMDYYYNSIKQCTDWFKEHELKKYKPTDTIVVASNASHIVYQYLKDIKNVKVEYVRYYERNQQPWDYAIFHIALIPADEIKAGTWLPPSTEYKASVRGETLSAVIKRPSTDDLKGYDALKHNQPDSAIMYFSNYLKKDPHNLLVIGTIGQILLQQNKIDTAYNYLKAAYDIDPDNTEIQQMYGVVVLSKGDYTTALNIFNKIVADNPDFPQGYYYLAIAENGAGNYQDALNNFNTAAQDPSLAPNCYKMMGDIFVKQGNQAQAQKMYEAAARATQHRQ